MKIDKIDPTNRCETVLDDFCCKAEMLGSQVRLGEAETSEAISELVHLELQMEVWEHETGMPSSFHHEIFRNQLKAKFPNLDWDSEEIDYYLYWKVVDKFGFKEACAKSHWLGNRVTYGFHDGMVLTIPHGTEEWWLQSNRADNVEATVLELVMEHYRSGFWKRNEVKDFNWCNDEVVAYVESLLAMPDGFLPQD